MIFDGLERFADRIAIITATKQYSYRELLLWADDIVSCIQTGDVVLLLSDNTVETVVAYIGAMRKKIPTIILNAHTPLDNIIDIVRRFLPTHIVGVNDKLEIEGYRKSLKKDRTTIWSTVSSLSTCVNEELAILLTTSGSTGSPKLVRLSHLNLLANTTSIT